MRKHWGDKPYPPNPLSLFRERGKRIKISPPDKGEIKRGFMKIILATNNSHKVKEIKKLLKIKGLEILSLSDFSKKIKVAENRNTFKGNAIKKAKAVSRMFNMIAVADDSGLCVDALGGKPGVRSARFVNPPVTPQKLCNKLLKYMDGIQTSKRKARFVCAVAVVYPNGKIFTTEGICNGKIGSSIKGSSGFGYDPVFIPKGHSKTFAEISMKEKNRMSHRGKAFGSLKQHFLKLLGSGFADPADLRF